MPMTVAHYPELTGKSVLVTGGGSGIGESIVRHFAAEGAKVGFIDIAAEPSRQLVRELTAARQAVHHELADLRDIAAMKAAIARIRAAHGPIAILVNNAAHDERHVFLKVTPDYFDDRIAVNLRHAYFAAQAAIPDMIGLGGGAIVNFGSISWISGSADLTAYGAAKAAAHGLTGMLAREFGPKNIRVNCVVPGWIMTRRQIDLWLTPEGEKQIFERQCLKRKMQPEDVARAVLFLASDAASGITNQSLVVDGGWI
jgi:D-xylose 1-dehydrogenase